MFNNRKSCTTGFTEWSLYGKVVEQRKESVSQHSNINYSKLHQTIFHTTEYGCGPLGIIYKRFYKMWSPRPPEMTL